MTANQYLQTILAREQVDISLTSPLRSCANFVLPHLQNWAGNYLAGVSPSGSFAKGTAVKSGTDIDLFISLSENTPDSLEAIYDSLFNRMQQQGFAPRKQNVSIGVKINGHDVDLVPARRQDARGQDHSLYRNRKGSWTKTNIATHIGLVANSNRTQEIRALKLWRNQNGLDFPSFYLELLAIEAMKGKPVGDLANNVFSTFSYFRDYVGSSRIVDPANTNNVISDDLDASEKARIAKLASQAAAAKTWAEIVR